jgi:glycosyltransferase involved in cell wall biosynthesis
MTFATTSCSINQIFKFYVYICHVIIIFNIVIMNYTIIILLILIIILLFCKSNNENFKNGNKQYKYGILICCYNRPEYLKQTLDSLKKTKLEDSLVYIIDDHSNNLKTIELIKNFNIPSVTIKKERNLQNLGITKSLKKGFSYLYTCCEFLTNLDSDVILKPDWLEKLHNVYVNGKAKFPQAKNLLVSGFNCTKSCAHKINKTYDLFYAKKTIGGINTFFHNSFFNNYCFVLRNTTKNKNYGWDWNLCRYCRRNNIPILVTKPSVVQHIGFRGLNAKKNRVDTADDF